MKLSICIPTLPERKDKLAKLLAILEPQMREDVEIVTNDTGREMTVGAKRNALLRQASGKYVVMIDDDDRVADDYIASIMSILDWEDVDAVGFYGILHDKVNDTRKEFRHSARYSAWRETPKYFMRNITPINVVRRQIALETPFKDISYGEDFEWAMDLQKSRKINNHRTICKHLYFYDFDSAKGDELADSEISFSQSGQDLFAFRHFNGKTDGLMVEVGAHDGLMLSNSLFLEDKGWKCVLVEANPDMAADCKVNRPNAIVVDAAAGAKKGKAKFSVAASNLLSGLSAQYPDKHRERVEGEGGVSKEITVNVLPLSAIFKDNNIQQVDWLAVDVEGAELEVLKGIDFEDVKIDLISLENNFKTSECEDYLKGKGYMKLKTVDHDDFYVKA